MQVANGAHGSYGTLPENKRRSRHASVADL